MPHTLWGDVAEYRKYIVVLKKNEFKQFLCFFKEFQQNWSYHNRIARYLVMENEKRKEIGLWLVDFENRNIQYTIVC